MFIALLVLWLVFGGVSVTSLVLGVVVSALIIFIAFKRPEHRRQAHEAARREREVTQLPNEEDL